MTDVFDPQRLEVIIGQLVAQVPPQQRIGREYVPGVLGRRWQVMEHLAKLQPPLPDRTRLSPRRAPSLCALDVALYLLRTLRKQSPA